MDGTTALHPTALGPAHAEVKVPAAAAPPPPACSSPEVARAMWCFQKAGFEGLLLAELQRQQQGGRLCDTVLKADGVLVPAHSCVLSALSPSLRSALVSTPPPPAGQCHVLEFHTLDACTLLNVVRLLYSGEMAGEGEKEKQEATSVAANLGICGLVEVRRGGRRLEGGGRQVEAGVQTEPVVSEENEGRRVKWRREARDGCAFLWKETLPSYQQDMWTQTEEVQGDTLPHSTETTDVTALQNAEEVDSQIPCIPISLLFTPDDNISRPSSATAASTQHATPADLASTLQPFSTLSAATTAEDEEWQHEQVQSFQGNIPGFINFFLNPCKEEGSCRGRAGRRRRARRAGAAERGAGKPRASTAGQRCRGRLTQTVKVSKVQKLFLQKSGRRSSRTGQGGGAAGRKLCLKTRESLRSAESRRGGRGHDSGLDFSQRKERLSHSGGGGQRTPVQHFKQMTPIHLHSIDTPSRLRPPPSPAASCMPPLSPLIHTTALPPMGTPPPEDQPERIDRLLEEVMIGLDILPKSAGAPSSMGPGSFGTSSAQNKRQDWSTSAQAEVPVLQQQGGGLKDMLEDFLQSFEQHLGNCGGREQEEEEEEEEETNGDGSTELSKSSTKTRTRTPQGSDPQNKPTARPVTFPQTGSQQGKEAETPRRRSTRRRSTRRRGPPPRLAEEPSGNHRTRRPYSRRRKVAYHFSLERKRARKPAPMRKPAPTREATLTIIHDLREDQLRQFPVVRLEKGVVLQGHGRQRLEVKDASCFLCKPHVDKQPAPAASSPGRTVEYGPSPTPVQPQEEEHATTGKKRRAESEGETPEDTKRIRSDSLAETTSESAQQANKDTEDEIDMDTVPLTSAGDGRGEIKPNLMCEEEEEGCADEVIDMDGDADPEKKTDDRDGISPFPSGCVSPPASPSAPESSARSTGDRDDEDIDMNEEVVRIQGESSDRDGDEDIDIVG